MDLDNSDVGFSLLCWDLWESYVQWRGSRMEIKAILDDTNPDKDWYVEPNTNVDIFNHTTNYVVTIEGCFRHKKCFRISSLGGGFENLTFGDCASITLADDFYGHVHREAKAVIPRGERTTVTGIRSDYLTRVELFMTLNNLQSAYKKIHFLCTSHESVC